MYGTVGQWYGTVCQWYGTMYGTMYGAMRAICHWYGTMSQYDVPMIPDTLQYLQYLQYDVIQYDARYQNMPNGVTICHEYCIHLLVNSKLLNSEVVTVFFFHCAPRENGMLSRLSKSILTSLMVCEFTWLLLLPSVLYRQPLKSLSVDSTVIYK